MTQQSLRPKRHFVKVQLQGSLLAAANQYTHAAYRDVPKRGSVTMFSKRSRSRMLKRFATMDFQRMKPVFITLTYGAVYPAPDVAKQHLRAFLKRLRRLASQKARKGGFVWRLEFQERGAPHFHIICTDLTFIPKEDIQRMWSEITGLVKPFTRIELIRSKKGVMSYVSKYLAKTTQSGGGKSSGFIYVPYQAAPLAGSEPTGEPGTIGRLWGIEDNKLIVYCEASWFTIPNGRAFLMALKCKAACEWQGINLLDTNGFSLFTRNGADWFHKILDLLEFDKGVTFSWTTKLSVS